MKWKFILNRLVLISNLMITNCILDNVFLTNSLGYDDLKDLSSFKCELLNLEVICKFILKIILRVMLILWKQVYLSKSLNICNSLIIIDSISMTTLYLSTKSRKWLALIYESEIIKINLIYFLPVHISIKREGKKRS